MEADAQPLSRILFSNSQFVVPFFQRSYSWDRENWERLSNDIAALDDAEPTKKHFLGPLVCALLTASPGSTPKYQLIDGQQRLTTLSLLLTAIRDVAAKQGDESLAAEISETYLLHRWNKGIERYKLLPRSGDRELFRVLVDGKELAADSDGRLVAGYHYFRKLVRHRAHRDAGYLRKLFEMVVNRLYLVVITLSEEDPYEIFESLNSTGLPLQESDLIRNFLFMQIPFEEQAEFQQEHWAPFEAEFEPSAGQPGISPTGFYRDFLMRGGRYSKSRETFTDFKAYYESNQLSPQSALRQLRRFVQYAKVIAHGGAGESPSVGFALRQFSAMEASTAHPVVLNLLDQRHHSQIEESEFVGCLNDLTSFVLRRSICGESTRTYGRWFCELAGQIGSDTRNRLQAYLLHRGWPDDATFCQSLMEFPIYRREFKKSRVILESLERADEHKEAVNLNNIQIEHVMPQKLPTGAAGKEWREMLGDEHKKIHDRWLHTLGNLTLTGYNPKLGNRSYAKKREELMKSRLSLNAVFEKTDFWNREQILDRAKLLAGQVATLWPRPSSEIAYVPPAKSPQSANKTRDRRRRYWEQFNELLEQSTVALRPSRKYDGAVCQFFLPMADVALYAQFRPAKKRMDVQWRFSRTRGRKIFAELEKDRDTIEASLETLATWETGKKPTISVAKQGVSLKDHIDWHDQHEWMIDTLAQFESAFMTRLESLHEAVKEKSDVGQRFLEYWIGFHRTLYDQKSQLQVTTPLPQHWNNVAVGRSNVWLEASVNKTESQIAVSLYLGTQVSRAFFQQLEQQRVEIEHEIGQPLTWFNPEGQKQWRIYLPLKETPFSDREDWPRQQAWLVEKLTLFDKLFRGRVQDLKKYDSQ